MRSGYHPLECFGKLPSYEDFIVETGHAVTVAFAKWIRDGRKHAYGALLLTNESAASDPTVAVVPPVGESAQVRVLYGPPGSATLLAGVLRPSRDKVGRDFPFGLFSAIPRTEFGKSWKLFPSTAVPVWDALSDTFDTLASVATREGFDEHYRGSLIPSPSPPLEAQSAYERELATPLGSLFDGSDGASLEALRRNLPVVLARLRKEPRKVRLQLPVHPDPTTAAHDASFWLDLLDRQFRLRSFEPNVFLRETPGKPDSDVLFTFGNLDPADYSDVMRCAAQAGGVTSPAVASPAPEGTSATAEPASGGAYADLLGHRF